MKKNIILMLCLLLSLAATGCNADAGVNETTDIPASTTVQTVWTDNTEPTEAEGTVPAVTSAETVLPAETIPAITEYTEAPIDEAPTQASETLPDHQHQYKSQFFEARCAQFPYTLYTCSCGHSYKQVDESNPPNDHRYSFTYSPLDSSIWSESMTAVCDICGDTYTTTVHARNVDPEIISQIEERTIYWLNEYRKAEGAGACIAPAVFQSVAGYRATQLLTNFSHDVADLREACAHFEYGEYKQPEGWDPSEYYYTFNGVEAIANGFIDSAGVDATAQYFARLIHTSTSHWSYVGDARFNCMAVGIAYRPGKIVGVVFVSEENFG